MSTVKLAAGVELDILNKNELHNELDTFARRLLAGVQYRKAVATVTADASGNIANVNNLAGGGETGLGPEPGFVWSVRRIVVLSQIANPTGNVAIFSNGNSYSDLEIPSAAVPFASLLSSEAFILYPGSTIIVQGSGLGANTPLTVKILTAEVAIEDIAKL